MDRIVVLMATWNGERYLAKQLDSILAQDCPGVRLVVQDDNSQDSTPSLLAACAERFPDKITVRRNLQNMGAAGNFLSLLKAESGSSPEQAEEHNAEHTYFMFADQDDIWMPDKVRRTLRRMKQLEARYGEARPALVFTDAEVVDSGGRVIASSFCKLQHLRTEERSLAHLLMENVCQGCTMMLNDALARKMRLPEPEEGFWPVRYHDWWTALTAAAFGCTSYLPEPTMQYRLHGSNVVGAEHFGAYVKRRAADWKEQRRALEATWKQAEAFRSCCMEELDGRKKKLLDAFCRMPEAGRAGRIRLALKYRFFKSGLIRNIGLLLNLLR